MEELRDRVHGVDLADRPVAVDCLVAESDDLPGEVVDALPRHRLESWRVHQRVLRLSSYGRGSARSLSNAKFDRQLQRPSRIEARRPRVRHRHRRSLRRVCVNQPELGRKEACRIAHRVPENARCRSDARRSSADLACSSWSCSERCKAAIRLTNSSWRAIGGVGTLSAEVADVEVLSSRTNHRLPDSFRSECYQQNVQEILGAENSGRRPYLHKPLTHAHPCALRHDRNHPDSALSPRTRSPWRSSPRLERAA